MRRMYCTLCDDYGHDAEAHETVRDYMTCLQLEEEFEEEKDGME